IDNEEYGEALSLAQAYNLDSDLVYQRQWRKSPVSIASIQDYLSKIRKRSWVLHECVERVPENVDAAKELLQYGLKGTDLEALIAIGLNEDGGRFIMPGDVDLDDLPYEDLLSDDEELGMKKEKEKMKRQELLAKVDFSRYAGFTTFVPERKHVPKCVYVSSANGSSHADGRPAAEGWASSPGQDGIRVPAAVLFWCLPGELGDLQEFPCLVLLGLADGVGVRPGSLGD
ncbi:hypothetical protein AMECASPLE_023783, partial [Ameca splendens]